MTQEINRQELIKELRNLFGFRGSTNFELGESVFPVANIADLETPPFHSKVGGVGTITQAAVAAQFSYCGLSVPLSAGRNFRATVRGVYLQIGTAGQNVGLGLANTAAMTAAGLALAAAVNQGGSWDSPVADTVSDLVRPQAVLGSTSLAATFFNNNELKLQAPTTPSLFIPLAWNIAPGNTLLVQCETVNVQLATSFYWDEYIIG